MSLFSNLFFPRGMLRMIFPSLIQKMVLIRSWFQFSPFLEMGTLIVTVSANNFGGDWTIYMAGVGSHLSPLILIFSPLPTLHLKPSFRLFLVEIMLFQIKEWWPFVVTSMKLLDLQYFSFKTTATSVWDCDTSLQSCLVCNALLKHSRSRIYIPPLHLWAPFFSQPNQQIFNQFSFEPQQNFAIILTNSLLRTFESKKTFNVCQQSLQDGFEKGFLSCLREKSCVSNW